MRYEENMAAYLHEMPPMIRSIYFKNWAFSHVMRSAAHNGIPYKEALEAALAEIHVAHERLVKAVVDAEICRPIVILNPTTKGGDDE